eukprot:472545_1
MLPSPVDTCVGGSCFYHAKRLTAEGKYLKAKERFLLVIQLRADAASPHYHLGCVLIELNKMQEAISHFKKALELKPDIINYKIFAQFYSKLNECYNDDSNEVKESICCLLNQLFPYHFQLKTNATEQEILQALNSAQEMCQVEKQIIEPDLNKIHKQQLLKHWKHAFERKTVTLGQRDVFYGGNFSNDKDCRLTKYYGKKVANAWLLQKVILNGFNNEQFDNVFDHIKLPSLQSYCNVTKK